MTSEDYGERRERLNNEVMLFWDNGRGRTPKFPRARELFREAVLSKA